MSLLNQKFEVIFHPNLGQPYEIKFIDKGLNHGFELAPIGFYSSDIKSNNELLKYCELGENPNSSTIKDYLFNNCTYRLRKDNNELYLDFSLKSDNKDPFISYFLEPIEIKKKIIDLQVERKIYTDSLTELSHLVKENDILKKELSSYSSGITSYKDQKISSLPYEESNNGPNGHVNAVWSLVHIDKAYWASGSFDKNILIWQGFGKYVKTITSNYSIRSMCNLGNGLIAIGTTEKVIQIWNIINDNQIKSFSAHTNQIYCLVDIGNGLLASGSADKTIKIWKYSTGELINTLKSHSAAVNALIYYSSDTLISASDDKTIIIWSISKNEVIKQLKSHKNSVKALIVLNETQFASGSHDSTIKIWDLPNGNLKLTILNNTQIDALCLLENNTIISGNGDYSIKLWNYENGELKKTIPGHKYFIRSILSLGDGSFASGSEDSNIKLWK